MLTVGSGHACVLLEDQTVRCWGKGDWGSLGQPRSLIEPPSNGPWPSGCPENVPCVGDNELPAQLPPVALPSPVIHVSAGDAQTCAQLENLSVHCWGSNSHYQLGFDRPEQTDVPLPTPAKFPPLVAESLRTGFEFTCGLSQTGSVYCVGSGPSREAFKQDCCGHGRTIGNGGLFPGFRKILQGVRPRRLLMGPRQGQPCALTSATGIRCWNGR